MQINGCSSIQKVEKDINTPRKGKCAVPGARKYYSVINFRNYIHHIVIPLYITLPYRHFMDFFSLNNTSSTHILNDFSRKSEDSYLQSSVVSVLVWLFLKIVERELSGIWNF